MGFLRKGMVESSKKSNRKDFDGNFQFLVSNAVLEQKPQFLKRIITGTTFW
jgi:hypothetical protein